MSTHAPTVIRRFVPVQFDISSKNPSRSGMRHMQGCAQRHPEEGDLSGEQPDQARHEQDRGRPCTSREKPTAAQDKCRHGELHLLILFTVVKVRDILVRMIDVGERQVKTDAFVGSLGNSLICGCVTKIPIHMNSFPHTSPMTHHLHRQSLSISNHFSPSIGMRRN